MRVNLIRTGLWLHTSIMTLAGLGFFLAPKTFAAFWPWALPPLAARFMGSLFLGGAFCTALAALAAEPLPVEGPALLGVGDVLIVSVALLDITEIGFSLQLVVWLAFFIGAALLLWALLLLRGRLVNQVRQQLYISHGMKTFFEIHLVVVLPVGLTMYLLPAFGQRLWPWNLSLINVRLLGTFFIGASIISIWSLRKKSWHFIIPILGLYAVFASMATIASIIHFSLFNIASGVTWVFFALYIFVASGAWYFLWRGVHLRNQTYEVGIETP